MSVVNIEFRASANFSELTAQVNHANASVMGLNATLNKVNGEKLADAFASFERGMVGSGKFTAATTQVISNTEKFGKALAQQKLTLSEYHRATSDFIRGRESQIKQLAMQQVAMDRSMVVTQGHTVGGQVRATVFTPTSLNETATKAALASKQMQIFNKVLNDGATSIINWGKNTQWAGRQLTVGLTLPLTLFGAAAGKAFMDADKQLVRMVKVYGDANTRLTNEQTAQLRSSVMNLGKELASAWGVSINETLGLAADFAAVGKQGDDLIASTRETSRLMVLGEIDRQTAMKTTLSIQSAFKESNVELADSINFLNAVENQTSATLEDLTTVIPKAGPVVRGLGGDVKDLALMFVAMKEGGVPAAESANAIKSGLASLINPTKKATEFLADYNINITKIIEKNQGKIVPTLLAVKEALDGLDPLNRSRAIEMMFGKFQFARISALFDNLGRAGSQTAQVMNLMGASTQQLAQIADRELKVMTESASGRWNRAIESIKANMAILGESILPIGTFFMNVADKIVSAFNSIPEGVKSAILILGGLVAVAGPVIMITGVLANFGGYIIKLIAFLRNLRSEGRGAFEYLTPEVKAAKEAGDLLSVGFDKASSATDRMAASINELIISLQALAATQNVTAVESAGASALGRSAIAQATMLSLAQVGAASESPALAYSPINIHNRKGRAEVTGFEASHLFPAAKIVNSGVVNDLQADRLASLSSILPTTGYSDSARAHPAAVVQRALKDDMLATTIFTMDQELATSMETRRQMLISMAGKGADQIVKGTNTTLRQVIMGLNPGDLKRLLPTVEDFKQTQIKYVAQMELLREKMATDSVGVKDATAAVVKAAKVGGPAAAAAELATQLKILGIGTEQVADRTAQIFKTISDDFYAIVQKQGVTQKEIDAAFVAAGVRLAQIEAEAIGFSTGGVSRTPLFSYMGETGSARGLQSGIVAQYQMQMEGAALALADNNAATAALTRQELMAVASTREYVLQGEKIVLQMNARGQVVGAEIAAGTAEAELLTIRNQQLKDLIRLINLDIREQSALNIATAELAESRALSAEETLASSEAGLATSGKSGGIFGGRGKMMGAMGALGMLSMIPMMLPDTGNASLDTGKSALSGAGMGAMMGMMAGPIGAGVGAAIGASIPLVTKLIDKMGEAERIYTSLTSTGETASNQFGLSIKTLADVQLDNLTGKTQEAKTAVDELAESLSSAGDGTSDKNFIDTLKSTDNADDINGYIRDKIVTLAASGANSQQIREYVAAALKASGKEEYALSVKAKLDSFELDKGASQVINDKINDVMRRQQANGDYKITSTALADAIKVASDQAAQSGNRVSRSELLDTSKSVEELGDKYGIAYDAIQKVRDEFAKLGDYTKEGSDAMTTLAMSMPLDKFMQLIPSLDTVNMSTDDLIAGVSKIPGVGEEVSNTLLKMKDNGATTEMMLQGIALKSAGVISSWETLGNLPPAQLKAYFQIYTNENKAVDQFGNAVIDSLNKKTVQIEKANAAAAKSSEKASEARQAAIQKMQDEEQARQDMYSDQKDTIKTKYDNEIQKLKDVEDARQKAFDHQKKIADRQKTMFGLQVSYREALAEGNFGAAAIARNDMATTQKQWNIEDSSEAAKSATDKKIALLEKERDAKIAAIEAAAKADKKASDAAIKNAQAAAKAADNASKNTTVKRIANEDAFVAQVKKTMEDTTLTFSQKMTEISRIAASQGIPLANALTGPLKTVLGSSDAGSIWRMFAKNMNDAPWDLISQLITAKTSSDPTASDKVWTKIIARTSTANPNAVNRAAHAGTSAFAGGGKVSGPGGPREDKIPAWLSNGEFVMNAAAVSKYGAGFMHAINAGRFANGGMVGGAALNWAKNSFKAVAEAIMNGAPMAVPGAGGSVSAPPSDNNISGNRALGKRMAGSRGWGSGSQWDALNYIFDHESGWSTTAYDPGQGSRRDPVDPRARLTWGIPQANPAHKMASAGPDWFDNPETQIKWGLGYIAGRYTDPLGAYAFGRKEGQRLGRDWGWYAEGGLVGIPKNAKFHRAWADEVAGPAAARARKISAGAKRRKGSGWEMAWVIDAIKKKRRGSGSSASDDTGGSGIFAIAPVGTRTVTNGKTYNSGGAHAEAWRDSPGGGVNDINASFGTPFHALLPGVVEHAAQGYYYPPGYVIVKNTDGSRIRYAHARVLVKPGDHVRAGDVVGTASTTNAIPIKGRSMTSPHLHFAWLGSRKLIQREHGYVPWLDDKGKMIKFANGGEVSASLLTGEHVMNRGASAKYGRVLEAMNNQRYHTGGVVTPSGPKRDTFASAEAGAYNVYNIDVDARGSDLSPQAVADLVMKGIEAKDKRKGGPRK